MRQLAMEVGEGRVVTEGIDMDQSNYVTDITGKPIALPEAIFKAARFKVSIYQLEEVIGMDLYPNLVKLVEATPIEAVETAMLTNTQLLNP